MRADDELKAAMADVLSSLQAAPDNPVSLLVVGSALMEQGFTQDQIINRLYRMEAAHEIKLLEGNRLRLIKPLINLNG
ncbi:hypothetical protein [Sinorhizobium sp. RAC02]|uniref:hypothetical protein n=1 Tax=Sinorhizobium sp. RAC02 TaxID=1842534 RepID=UPI00083E1E70|nr:hypothetical protein [Sinorhizobium sp. RAC02]